jgi:hypothetical protein
VPRPKNASKGVPFNVTISEQSVEILERLAKVGPYGRNAGEVGGRLLEQVLAQRFIERPRFALTQSRRRR